jgi:hypothetical protein
VGGLTFVLGHVRLQTAHKSWRRSSQAGNTATIAYDPRPIRWVIGHGAGVANNLYLSRRPSHAASVSSLSNLAPHKTNSFPIIRRRSASSGDTTSDVAIEETK